MIQSLAIKPGDRGSIHNGYWDNETLPHYSDINWQGF
jgi:hypothetical protein